MSELKELLDRYGNPCDESKFASISDDIWQLGDIKKIKDSVSDEIFTFFVAINLIGNWQCGGWGFIFCEMRSLLPYAGGALAKLGLDELVTAFENTQKIFPDFAKECDESTYVDVINFLLNPKFKVSNTRLNAISTDDRLKMSQMYHKNIQILDDLSESFWGYGTPHDGFGGVVEYIKRAK
ncbi:hypothetical protein U5B43_04075 [Campylobacter sp. 9BO]|uniref:hypothetical protein n=1 Tax=Campylobacter sp. 9BO TaxID=3424759 RepID=UPI003D3472F6